MSAQRQSNSHRRQLAGSFGSTVCLCAVLIGCDGGGQPAASARTSPPISQPSEPAQVLFDIPALVGKSIDEVRQILGPPQDEEIEPTQQQLAIGVDEWSNVFTNEAYELLVTFNPRTRRVTDFFIEGSSRATLMQRGNLTENSTAYRLEEVRALSNPSKITGIKVVPKG